MFSAYNLSLYLASKKLYKVISLFPELTAKSPLWQKTLNVSLVSIFTLLILMRHNLWINFSNRFWETTFIFSLFFIPIMISSEIFA